MLNHCYHRKQKFSFKNEFPSDVLEKTNGTPMFTYSHSNTDKTVMNNELKHVLETAIVRISEDYRMVFALRELNGMSTRETSEALNITESNVKVRLNRAKGLLRKEIEKMYSPEEIFDFNLIYCNRIVENVLKHMKQNKNEDHKAGFLSNLPLSETLNRMNIKLDNWKQNFRKRS